MKKLILLFVAASLFMVCPTIAAADHYSDGTLLQKACTEALKLIDSRSKADPVMAGTCLGYIQASNDMYEIMVNNANRTICIPPGLDVNHLIMVVVKYLNEHPEKLQNVASASVYESFQQYFPCIKPKPEK